VKSPALFSRSIRPAPMVGTEPSLQLSLCTG
jgi:hypothetical protein